MLGAHAGAKPSQQPKSQANNRQSRDASPLASQTYGQRSPIQLDDPTRRRARTPPRDRQGSPIGEDGGAGLRTPASTSYKEHNFGDCDMFAGQNGHDNKDVSNQESEPDGERDRREDVRAELFREHRRLPSREPELYVRRHARPRHKRSSRDEEPSQNAQKCRHQPCLDQTEGEDASQATQATQATRGRRLPQDYQEEESHAREEPDQGEDPVEDQDLPVQQPPYQQGAEATPPWRSGQMRQPPQWYTPPPQ